MRGVRPLLVGLVTAAIGSGCAAPPPIAQFAFLTRIPKTIEPSVEGARGGP